VLFKKFAMLKKEDLADISREIELLSEIKDVLDELNIMAVLFDDQQKVLKQMDCILSEDQAEMLANEQGQGNTSQKREMNQENGKGQTPSSQLDKAYKKQRSNSTWGARDDSKHFGLPLTIVFANIVDANIIKVGGMKERADKAHQAVRPLTVPIHMETG
jgi:hypothetical protein